MIFNTKYERPEPKPEINNGPVIVEKAGYIPAKKRIENMMLAGQRLKDYRTATYDFPDGKIDFELDDPTRHPNFDMADATQISLRTEQNIINSKRAKEALQKQQEAPEKLSKDDQYEDDPKKEIAPIRAKNNPE